MRWTDSMRRRRFDGGNQRNLGVSLQGLKIEITERPHTAHDGTFTSSQLNLAKVMRCCRDSCPMTNTCAYFTLPPLPYNDDLGGVDTAHGKIW